MNREAMEQGIRLFLEALQVGLEAGQIERTPQRVARAWSEDLLSGYSIDPASVLTWTEVEQGGGPVLVRRISLASICAHHLLPFFGNAHVAYLPGRRLAGLSKIGRVVDAHSRRLQTQEQLSAAIVSTLAEGLEPRGVIAMIEAEHTCMTLRGVRKELSRMKTVAADGVYRDDPAARREILGLLADGA